MTEPTINPDYQLYVTRFNVMFHDYNMVEADIAAMLGPEPLKYLPLQPQTKRVVAIGGREGITIASPEFAPAHNLSELHAALVRQHQNAIMNWEFEAAYRHSYDGEGY